MKLQREQVFEHLVLSSKKLVSVAEKLLKWDTELDLTDNAKELQTSYGSARCFALRYKLEYKSRNRNRGASQNVLKASAYQALVDNGFTYEDIGKLFGVKRQAVHEYLRLYRRKK